MKPPELYLKTACELLAQGVHDTHPYILRFALLSPVTTITQHGRLVAAEIFGILGGTIVEVALKGCSAQIINIVTETQEKSYIVL